MAHVRRLTALLLSLAIGAAAQGNVFDRVRYNGGTVASKVKPDDWRNKLTITSTAITLSLRDKQTETIDPKRVTSLSYGQEAHRRVGTMIALAILVAPVALFGLFAKTRLHFIGIQYTTETGKMAGVLLQGDKDNYRAILVALQSVSGVPVSVSEKEREFIPIGVTTAVTKDESGPAAAQNSSASPSPAPSQQLQSTAASEESVLLGISGYSQDGGGVRVAAVAASSPAARSGIKPGDVIMAVDGRPVSNAREIEAAAGTSATGTVRIMYFSGVLQTAADVKIR